jgi:hypothetical protein
MTAASATGATEDPLARPGDLEALRREVQRLSDMEEIKLLKGRYCRYCDTKNWQAWADEVLTEDFHFESEGGVQEGRDAAVAMVSASLEGATTVHHCHTPEITFTGPDTADVIWAMQDHVAMTFKGETIAFRGAGHYYEQYVRTDAGWRIRSTVLRRLSVDMLKGEPPSPDH